jgi:hypothetical protein
MDLKFLVTWLAVWVFVLVAVGIIRVFGHLLSFLGWCDVVVGGAIITFVLLLFVLR